MEASARDAFTRKECAYPPTRSALAIKIEFTQIGLSPPAGSPLSGTRFSSPVTGSVDSKIGAAAAVKKS
jgi:hypothetical protein